MIEYEHVISKMAWIVLFTDVFLKPQSLIIKAFLALITIAMLVVLVRLRREKKALKR
ncbi:MULTISPECIES: hypothetical protein [Lactiplantibacillus]|jgi:hypothetical protein|uniref:hypothetical protein n=1 Tax=Lactiplantibacillus TaxID=2767842 RepID=UPI001403BCC1|nr:MULTISPECIES: hypothetical protein [Lactiplantibacillus]MCC3163503.1 hypothetical protein [Lactiplantibacillus pentosus]MCJ8188595.1 hypothetical protein [Lactiplantibacillus pentosus]MCM8607571.1 hypothetical protein [Lactiplantibacillus sp. B652]USJ86356.1 hypothetical protein KSF55_00385 [Lactiplantibacillus pentosus]